MIHKVQVPDKHHFTLTMTITLLEYIVMQIPTTHMWKIEFNIYFTYKNLHRMLSITLKLFKTDTQININILYLKSRSEIGYSFEEKVNIESSFLP
jgi:hypothetical protein